MWLHDYLKDFPGKQDVLRYVLTANAPETKDNNFTWKDFQARNNNELVAVYGNFVNRALQLTKKYYNGVVPEVGELTAFDHQIIDEFTDVKNRLEQLLDTFHFRDAQKEAMDLARIGNKYLAESEPWKVIKTDPQRVGTILNVALQLVANLSIAFEPFLPFSSKSLRDMLALETCVWGDLGRIDILRAGHRLNEPKLLFSKIEDSEVEAQMKRLQDTVKANAEAESKVAPVKANIGGLEEFQKLDIRVGLIKACEKVAGKDKLLKFTIDDGLGGRTIVSGIAKYYKPEELVGKQVCFIANLPPRKFGNIESQGMILSALNYDGSISVTTVDREVKSGSEVE